MNDTSLENKKVPKTKTFSLRSGRFVHLFLFVIALVGWYGYQEIFANANPFSAGETLDPDCLPGDTNCTVSLFPSQAGHSGKFLTTDGAGNLSWASPDVELNPTYTPSGAVTATVGGIASGTTINGDTTISLQSLLDQIFYAISSPTSALSLSSGSSPREVGSSASFSIGWTATRGTPTNNSATAITAIGLSITSGTASITSGGTISPTGNTQSGSATVTADNTTPNTSNIRLTVAADTRSASVKNLSLEYRYKAYWFVSATDLISSGTSESTVNSQVLAKSVSGCGGTGTGCSSSLNTSTSQSFTLAPSSQFLYYAIPTSFGSIDYTSSTSGFSVQSAKNNSWARRTVSFTNASGATTNYYLYAFPASNNTSLDDPLTGSFNIVAP